MPVAGPPPTGRGEAGCGVRRVLPPPPTPALAAVVAVVVAGTVLGLAAPASAHTRLVSSTPAQDVAAQAPHEVVLAFSDAVQTGLSTVRVTGSDGAQHAAGSPSPAGDGASVVQALRSPLAPGSYAVAYRVIAADGHPVTGSFEITAVAAASAPATPAAGPSAAAPRGTTTGSVVPSAGVRDSGSGPPLLPMAVGGLLVAGGAGLLARRLGGAPPEA